MHSSETTDGKATGTVHILTPNSFSLTADHGTFPKRSSNAVTPKAHISDFSEY